MLPRSTAFAALAAALLAPSAQAQDAGAGERVFGRCMACHQLGEGARNRTGPVLTGVLGRRAASVEGFRYSESMAEAGRRGLVWNADLLFEYLAGPDDFLKSYLDDGAARAKMAFRLPGARERRDVIAYLGTVAGAPAPADRAATGGDGPGTGTRVDGTADGLCVANGSGRRHLFAAETRDGGRVTAMLDPGEELCAEGAADGFVSVYESADGFEGCSRLVPAHGRDTLLSYADFDRCAWDSNS